MESRFAHLRQRDTSVSMLRTKMSRRRSQSQKENRERTVNTRRQLLQMDKIEEIKPANSKVDERIKQLERWKERKALEKEKAKREKERKGVFKTGLYHPKDTFVAAPLPDVPAASARVKGKKVDSCQSVRVTRSMKQQPLRMEDANTGSKKREAQAAVDRPSRTRGAAAKTGTNGEAVRALSTRSVNRPPVAAAPPEKDKTKNKTADVRTTRSRAVDRLVAPAAAKEKKIKEAVKPAVFMLETPVSHQEEVPCAPGPPASPQEEAMLVDQTSEQPVSPADPAEPLPSRISFAPTGFIFQAPVGLPKFKFEPMTPRSANAFLTPSPTFSFSPGPVNSVAPQAESDKPPHAPPCPSPPTDAPCSPSEAKHDVPYFRSEVSSVTDRLTALSLHWESKVEDESIPEEMRDRMRTAVGQARLLMKERFNQFSGLVDDCELGRGDKVTTCSDLQGFWDMVYYQVEDVNKKFDALKEAECRGWVEEHKPPPRQRKAVKKPSAAPAKPTEGKAAAAKSRLAAVKAAMKARQQAAEAEKKARAAEEAEPDPEEAQSSSGTHRLDQVVFDRDSINVTTPSKPAVRRSSRLSAAAPPQPSPCSTYLSPRRVTRRSLAQTPARLPASAQTPAPLSASAQTPAQTPAPLPASAQTPAQTPAPLPASAQTPQLHQQSPAPGCQAASPLRDPGNVSLCFSPVKEALTGGGKSGGSAEQEEIGCVLQLSPVKQTLPVNVGVETTEPVDVSLRHSPRFPTAPPLAAEPNLLPSPGGSPTQQPPPDSPAVSSQESLCLTPDELPGLDFERYLLAGSPSPRETECSGMWSPLAADVEMASPRGEHEDLTTQEAAATPGVSSGFNLQSPQVQTAECQMLLFTPDIKDRIRESVCPSDLMVFTPPNI